MSNDTSSSGRAHAVTSFFKGLKSAGLPYPGPFEQLHREAKSCFTQNHLFDGGKADIGKLLSPTFQLSHSFASGSSSSPPQYTFSVVNIGEKSFFHGSMDHTGMLSGRCDYTLGDWSMRLQTQLSSQTGQQPFSVEGDYRGKDYAANLKLINANPLDMSGTSAVSYLQSVTRRLACGVEAFLNRQGGQRDTALTLVTRYIFGDLGNRTGFTTTPLNPAMQTAELQEKQMTGQQQEEINPSLTVTVQSAGIMNMSYYHPLTARAELGAELQMLVTGSSGPQAIVGGMTGGPLGSKAGGSRRESLLTLGGRFAFRQSMLRAQVDSLGKVSSVLEEQLSPGFSLIMSGELDHLRGSSKFGLGIHLEI